MVLHIVGPESCTDGICVCEEDAGESCQVLEHGSWDTEAGDLSAMAIDAKVDRNSRSICTSQILDMGVFVHSIHTLELEVALVHRWTVLLALQVEEDDRADDRDEIKWQIHEVLDDVARLELWKRRLRLVAHALPYIAAGSDLPAFRDKIV